MKTLFVYYCSDESLVDLFRTVGGAEFDVFRIEERYEHKRAKSLYYSLCGRGVRINECEADFTEYDSIVLASTLTGAMPAPAVNEFLHKNNLKGTDVSCLLIHSGKPSRKASEAVHKMIFLAGGNCRGIVNLPAAELRRNAGHAGEYIRKKLAAEI